MDALAELSRRLHLGSLSQARVNDAVQVALAAQADLKTPWDYRWGLFIDDAHAAGKLRAEDYERYLRQAPQLTVQFRRRVRRGDPMPFEVSEGLPRLGLRCNVIRVMEDTVQVNGMFGEADRVEGPIYTGVGNGGIIPSASPLWKALAPGPQMVHLKIRHLFFPRGHADSEVRFSSTCDPPYEQWEEDLQWPKPLATREVAVDMPFELLPSDTPSVRRWADAKLRAAVRASLKATVRMGKNPAIEIDSNFPPVALAFDVFVRDGDREYRAEGFTAPANERSYDGHYETDIRPRSSKVDLILRPSEARAAGSIGLEEFWGEDVVLSGIPVEK